MKGQDATIDQQVEVVGEEVVERDVSCPRQVA